MVQYVTARAIGYLVIVNLLAAALRFWQSYGGCMRDLRLLGNIDTFVSKLNVALCKLLHCSLSPLCILIHTTCWLPAARNCCTVVGNADCNTSIVRSTKLHINLHGLDKTRHGNFRFYMMRLALSVPLCIQIVILSLILVMYYCNKGYASLCHQKKCPVILVILGDFRNFDSCASFESIK